MQTHYVMGALAATGATAALFLTPAASADPVSTTPDCTTVPGGTYTGTGTTECQTPGDVEIAATAPAPEYPFPWGGDEFFGPELGIGGGDRR